MYVAGFVMAVKTTEKEAYLKTAQMVAAVYRDYGCTRVVENWGDDVPDGALTSFPLAVQAGPDETVVFSWLEFPDKDTYTACMEQSMDDPRFAVPPTPEIMDGKRMIMGGFETLIDQ